MAAAVATKGLPRPGRRCGQAGRDPRLLAMVPPEGIQRAEARQEDKVNVWPHLLLREAVAAFAVFAFVTVFDGGQRASARAGQQQPDPEPLQGALVLPGPAGAAALLPPDGGRRDDPPVALLALMAAPYFDKNPSMRPRTASWPS